MQPILLASLKYIAVNNATESSADMVKYVFIYLVISIVGWWFVLNFTDVVKTQEKLTEQIGKSSYQ